MRSVLTDTQVEGQTELGLDHTTATTQVVETTAASSERWIIDSIWCTGDTSGKLQIKDSDDAVIYTYYYSANSGFVLEDKHLRLITKGKGFKYTQTGGGNYHVGMKYHKQRE